MQTETQIKKCFACDRKLRDKGSWLVTTADGQTVYVGTDCRHHIAVAGAEGYQPPKGGPRLYLITTTTREPR